MQRQTLAILKMLKIDTKRKIKIAAVSILAVFALGAVFHASFFVRGQDEETINQEVRELNLKIKENRDRIESIQKKQEEYNRAIKAKQTQKADLSNQLAILDNRIAKAQLDIESVSTDIDRTGLEIEKTNLEIKDKEMEILKEKEHISAVLRLLYKQDQATVLEVLLLNNSLTDFLNQIK
jgi:peptidoglycan hydrolase CwlO-like protein